MSRKTVCIEREYGSNGRKIAEWLSKKTGIPLYDKKALTQIAEENHLVPENSVSEEKKIQEMHREAIKFLADKESCIFVGTCAAGVLQGRDKNISVFVKAKSAGLWTARRLTARLQRKRLQLWMRREAE